MLGGMMDTLFTDVDTEARVTSIPLAHAVPGLAPDVVKQERRRRQVQRMVRAGQCDMELLPEPKQTVLM